MAEDSVNLGFTTNVGDVVGEIQAGMARLEQIFRGAESSFSSGDFGGALLANLNADLNRAQELVAQRGRAIGDAFQKAISSAHSGGGFQRPGAAPLLAQQNALTSGVVGQQRAITDAYAKAAPQWSSIIRESGAQAATASVGMMKEIREATYASALQSAKTANAAGANIPVRTALTGAGRQDPVIQARLENSFRDAHATTSEAASQRQAIEAAARRELVAGQESATAAEAQATAIVRVAREANGLAAKYAEISSHLNPDQYRVVAKSSPLLYGPEARSRLEVQHPDAPPPKPREYTFDQFTDKRGKTTPGTDPSALAYVDYHKRAENSAYIDFMTTRSDARGQGHAERAIDALYQQFRGGTVDFGEIMHPHAAALQQKMAARYPDVETKGYLTGGAQELTEQRQLTAAAEKDGAQAARDAANAKRRASRAAKKAAEQAELAAAAAEEERAATEQAAREAANAKRRAARAAKKAAAEAEATAAAAEQERIASEEAAAAARRSAAAIKAAATRKANAAAKAALTEDTSSISNELALTQNALAVALRVRIEAELAAAANATSADAVEAQFRRALEARVRRMSEEDARRGGGGGGGGGGRGEPLAFPSGGKLVPDHERGLRGYYGEQPPDIIGTLSRINPTQLALPAAPSRALVPDGERGIIRLDSEANAAASALHRLTQADGGGGGGRIPPTGGGGTGTGGLEPDDEMARLRHQMREKLRAYNEAVEELRGLLGDEATSARESANAERARAREARLNAEAMKGLTDEQINAARILREFIKDQTRVKVTNEKTNESDAEIARLAHLQAREAAGTASRFGSNMYRTNEGDFFKTTQGGAGARLLGGTEAEAASLRWTDAQNRAAKTAEAEAKRQEAATARQNSVDEAVARAKEELANAERLAAEHEKDNLLRAGSFSQVRGTSDIYKETSNGAKLVESDLELIRARKALATELRREQTEAARQQGGFFSNLVTAATARSSFGGTQQQFSLKQIPGNLGTQVGRAIEYTSAYAGLYAVQKLLSDTKKETLDYIDSLTNLQVRMEGTGRVTDGFVNSLEGLSRVAGSNVGAELDAAARSIAAFGDTSKNTGAELRQIGKEGADASSQLAVIAGTDLPTANNNLIAVASSFGIASNQLGQVNDAIANAKKLGGDANDIAAGLAGIAGAAQQAGLNMQQAADIISLVTARTNESGTAAATRITALFSLLGSHQDTLKGLGVDTTQSTADQINQLAGIFPKLTSEQQKATLSSLGGRTALRELIPILKDNTALQRAYTDSLDNAGAGTDEFNRKNADLAGLFRKIGGDITNIQINLVRSGIFDGIGLALKLLEPGLRTVSDLLGEFDKMIGLVPGLRSTVGVLLDIYAALKLVKAFKALSADSAIVGAVSKATGGLVKPGAKGVEAGAEGAEAAASGASTAASTANTAATAENTAATAANSAAKTENAAASGEDVAAMEAEVAAREATIASVEAELGALAGLTDIEAELIVLQARMGEGALQQSAALEEQAAILEGLGILEARHLEYLAGSTEAELASAAASLENAAALRVEAEAMLGVGAAGEVAGAGRAAAGAGGLASRAGGLLSGAIGKIGPVGLGIGAAIGADMIYHHVQDAADKMTKSMSDLADAMTDVTNASDPEAMRQAATNLRAAADERAKSTSGFFGTIGGFIQNHIPGGGPSSNEQAHSAREAAKALDARAKALEQSERDAAKIGSGAVFGSAPNSIESLKAGFDKMAASGDSAATKIKAVVAALTGIPGKSGPGFLLPGQGPTLGAKIGSLFEQTTITSLAQHISGAHDESLSDAKKVATADIKNLTPQFSDPKKAAELQQKIQDTVTQYISDAGLQNGGQLTAAQRDELATKIANLYVNPHQNAKAQQDTRDKIKAHVLAQINSHTDPAALIVDQDTSDFVQQQLVQQATQDASELTAANGDKVGAARKALADINQAIALATEKNTTVDESTYQAQLIAQHNLTSALNDQANSLLDLASAQMGSDEAVGQAMNNVTKANNDYATAVANNNTDDQNKAQIEQANAAAALKQALLQQANSAVALKEKPNDSANQDQGALQQAENTLANTTRYDANGQQTAAYNQALKGVADAKAKVAQDQVDAANAVAEAVISSQNPTGQLLQQLSEAEQRLKFLQANGGGVKELADASKNVADLQNQVIQSTTDDTNSALDAGTDQRDPVATALTAYQKATNNYNSLVAQGAKGKPLDDAYAAMIAAHQQLNAANIASLNQDAESNVKLGDSLGAAKQKYLSELNTANSQVGSQKEATLRQAAQDKVAYLRLAAQIDDSSAKLKIDPRDSIALASQAIVNDKRVLKIPGQETTDIQAEQLQLQQDRLNKAQLELARDQSHRLANARQGDPLSQAAAQLSNAREALSKDQVGTQKYFDDMAALAQQELAYAQAQRDHAANLALLQGDTTDPVEQARIALLKATQKLRDDQRNKTGDLAQDQLDKETADQAAQKAQFDQNLANQQNAYQLHEESADQYLTFLKSQDSSIRKQLAGMKKGQEGYQQLVDELNTIDQAIQGLNDQLQGQFNLGSIKLPTVYEVRRAETQGATAASSSIANSVTNNNITINGTDMQTVINYLSSVLGKSSMTVATTGRKGA